MPYSVSKATKKVNLRASVIDGAAKFYKIPSQDACASNQWENDQGQIATFDFMHFDNKDEVIMILNVKLKMKACFGYLLQYW